MRCRAGSSAAASCSEPAEEAARPPFLTAVGLLPLAFSTPSSPILSCPDAVFTKIPGSWAACFGGKRL